MPNVRISVPSPFGGVSAQPPSIRHRNQVEAAINAKFDVAYGYSKRPPTQFVAKIASLIAGGDYRLHVIERDADEKYLVLYGRGDIRVFDLDGVEQTVDITADAQDYLDDDGTVNQAGASADDLILATSADYTLIGNRNVAVRAGSSTRFALTAEHTDYDAMIATSPTTGTYHRTKNAGGGQPAGYWQFVSGAGTATFAKWYSRNLSSTFINPAFWSAGARNPCSFKFEFVNPLGANLVADVTALTFTAPASMNDVAAQLQAAIRTAASDTTILVAYETVSPSTGRFVITSAFSGSGAKIIGPTRASTYATTYDHTANDRAFKLNDKRASRVDGTGDPTATTLDIIDRWTRVAAPGQINAVPTPTSLPIALKRLTTAYIDEDDDYTPSTWLVDLNVWKSRLSGDDDSNPPAYLFPTSPNDVRRINDLIFFKNRLVFGVDDHVVMSGADDLFNLYIDDVTNLTDADRIDVAIGSADVNIVDFFVTFRGGLVIFSKAGRQFELKSTEPITPSNTPITPTTRYQTAPNVRPAAMHHLIYFAGNRARSSQVYEYFFSDSDQTNIAAEVTKHVNDFVPADIKTIETSPNNTVVIALERDDHRLSLYTPFWNGNQKVQSAWTRYELDATDRIVDIAVIRDDCYLLIELDGGQFVIDRLSLADESPVVRSGTWFGIQISSLHYANFTAITDGSFRITVDGVAANISGLNFSTDTTLAQVASRIQTAIRAAFSASPIVVEVRSDRFVITSGTEGPSSSVGTVTTHSGATGTNIATAALLGTPGTSYEADEAYAPLIDRRQAVTGTYDSGTNLTTFEHGSIDPTITTLVLGRDFGADAGSVLIGTAIAAGTGSKLTLPGQLDYGPVYMGRPYEMSVQHSRPYVKDGNDEPVINGRLQLVKLSVNHRNSGYYSVRVEQDGKDDRETKLAPYRTGVALLGVLDIDDSGELSAWVRGGSDSTRVFIENDSPLPSIITGLEFAGEFTRRTS